jgi:hypothetical protein
MRCCAARVQAACSRAVPATGSPLVPPSPQSSLPPATPCHPASLASRRPLCAQGFDEYMNVVLDDAEEVDVKKKTRKPLGRLLLKGDNITLLAPVQQQAPASVASSAAAVAATG